MRERVPGGDLMNRRQFLAASAGLAMPAIARAQSERVLTFVPQADLSVLDPIRTTTYQTRDHAFSVFDTLFGIDASYQAQPQMCSMNIRQTA
jgi:peptide/nickel transport system substrate-binding protein